jgi:hypothetical protein
MMVKSFPLLQSEEGIPQNIANCKEILLDSGGKELEVSCLQVLKKENQLERGFSAARKLQAVRA